MRVLKLSYLVGRLVVLADIIAGKGVACNQCRSEIRLTLVVVGPYDQMVIGDDGWRLPGLDDSIRDGFDGIDMGMTICECDAVELTGCDLLVETRGYLASDDRDGLRAYLHWDWSVDALAGLVDSGDRDVAKMAAYCLGVWGDTPSVFPLVRALQHDDSQVAEAAEDALWGIWIDAVARESRANLIEAMSMMSEGDHPRAAIVLSEIIDHDPACAEAYNQRSMARFLSDDFVGSLEDARCAVGLNGCHFGAMAGMGHAYARLGDVDRAVGSYRAALRIHPRMAGLQQTVHALTCGRGRDFRHGFNKPN